MTQDKKQSSEGARPMLYWHFVGSQDGFMVRFFHETVVPFVSPDAVVTEVAYEAGTRRRLAYANEGGLIEVVLDIQNDPAHPLPPLDTIPQFYVAQHEGAASALLSRYDSDNPMCALSLEDAAKFLSLPYQFDDTRPERAEPSDRGAFGTLPGSAAHWLVGQDVAPATLLTMLEKATDILWRRWDIARECVARHNPSHK